MRSSCLKLVRTLSARLFVLISVFALASCGGSGGGSNNSGSTSGTTVSTDATLSALSLNHGTFTSPFSSNTISYSATVAYAVTSVAVNATTTDSNATYTVNGGSSLKVGSNIIDVVVTAQDGATTKTYSITVTRQAASSDATLSALSISNVSLSSAFSSSTTTYSYSVDYTVSSVTVNPTATDSHATIKVNGSAVASGSNSGAISLNEGKNTISVDVTAQDGVTTKTYTITVAQLPALSGLSLTNASLDQVFQSKQLSYTSSVNFLVNAIGEKATLQNSADGLTIGGKKATSGTLFSPVYLATDTHNVDTVVTASDGTTNTYSIAVKRNSSLSQNEDTAADAASGDDFGTSVAISGNTMVVGADTKSTGSSLTNNGEVYVYTRSSATAGWTYQTTLTAGAPGSAASSDHFGASVAIDGNTIVVGAPNRSVTISGTSYFGAGAVYVFTGSGSTWNQTAYLPDVSPSYLAHFGGAVSVSGATLVVGANGASSQGAAYVYAYNTTTTSWDPQGTLVGSNTASSDQFGNSVAIDKDTIVVGAPLHSTNANHDGAAYIFTRSGTSWTQSTTILSEGSAGVLNDNFGQTVAISGNTIAVGATGVNTGTGAVYVFYNDGTGWAPQGGVLTAGNPDTGDAFGFSLALSGERLVVGADQEDGSKASIMASPDNSTTDAGAVYVFMRSGTSWSQTAYLKAIDAANSDYFGSSVGIDNDTLVTGARNKTVSGFTGAGAIYTFQ